MRRRVIILMENKIQELSRIGIAYYKNGMTSMLAVWCWMVKFPTRPREMRSLTIAAMGSAHVASMCCTSALLDLIRKKNEVTASLDTVSNASLVPKRSWAVGMPRFAQVLAEKAVSFQMVHELLIRAEDLSAIEMRACARGAVRHTFPTPAFER